MRLEQMVLVEFKDKRVTLVFRVLLVILDFKDSKVIKEIKVK